MGNVNAVLTLDVIKSKKSIDLITNYLNEEQIDISGDTDDIVIKFLKYKCLALSEELRNKNWVISDIVPLAGDSAQVICKNVEYIPEIIRMIRFNLRPLSLRIGIGLGSIGNYLYEENDPWNRSGSAFYNAREAIDTISKKSNKVTYLVIDKKNIEIYNKLQESINTIFMFIDDIILKWSDAKWKSVQAYEKYGVYDKAAEKLNMSRQAVNKNCKSAKYEMIKEAENTLKLLFMEVIKDRDFFKSLF